MKKYSKAASDVMAASGKSLKHEQLDRNQIEKKPT